ncbi:hypothetical protein [Paraburkholderia humisilvae]|uniref:SMP-30/Gluconolactonase/LRE-like region domain-containing protein n=1 Tax=Paraburkholderia humisilvae TaxID=627669 RepID=A0A6J5DTB2_9BURK|nr:hypothetical protein [Paraburkholderia humisilvae]CAB3757153.1 hypothetical protein LMG29542_03019 [Paraburkholderia humisilvae]
MIRTYADSVRTAERRLSLHAAYRKDVAKAALTVVLCTFIAYESIGPVLADDSRLLPPATVTSSTVPVNGDVNPYGVAFVPQGFPAHGTIGASDLLVSNFNNVKNLQGTGTTIVKIVPNGNPTVFFQGPAGLGLTTALGVLRAGFVLVGNVPTTDGTFATIQPGSLLVLNRAGNVVTQWTPANAGLDGPWDLTIFDLGDHAKVFVSNVLNGTVVRLDITIDSNGVRLQGSTRVASGYPFRADPAALVVGPTGLAYDPQRDVLYVASTVDNAVFAVFGAGSSRHDGGKGVLIYADNQHLHGPLALALGPNGHLFTANGDAVNGDPNQPSEVVEFTPQGRFVAQISMDPAQGGAFGLAFSQVSNGIVHFAAVDDNVPNITSWSLPFDDMSH